MHHGLVEQSTRFKKRIASTDLSTYKVVNRGQLVVGFPIDEGVLDFQEVHPAGIVSPAYGVWDVIDERQIDRRYLKLALRSPQAFTYYKTKLRGSTARRRSLPADVFLSLPVRLPPLSEQRRIATILDYADSLRTKRRQILTHLDSLAAATFIDMFGDPLTNSRNISKATIGSFTDVVTGNSPSRADSANFGNTIEWIKSDNLGKMIATQADESLSQQGRTKARVAPTGSILVTCIAGSPRSIGKSSLVDRDVAFNQQINAILPSPDIHPLFLLSQLKTAPELVQEKSTGGMKGLVSKSSFQAIEVLFPPMSEQEKFATRMGCITKQIGHFLRMLTIEEELFISLQAQAFSHSVVHL